MEEPMKHLLIIASAGLLLTTSAFAAEVTKPAEFAKMAAVSNMFEIQSSEWALKQSEDAGVKKFAEHMIADHSKAGEEMMPAAKAEKVEVPTELDTEHKAKLDALKAADKSSFDKMYKAEQLKAHETAVALFSVYSANGEPGELKTFATKTLPTLTEHLADVKKMN
jgi:putative membrane protein